MEVVLRREWLPCWWNTVMRLVVVLCALREARGVVKLPPNTTAPPAVIAFGDSILDTGNNNDIKTLVKANFPPYGKDFQGGIPTGRFCNGRVPSDLLVEELGIKEYLPAYLDPNLKPTDLPTGVCFASGASGYDPLTPKIASVIPMSDQVEMFKEYIEKLKGIVGEERTKEIVGNSLYVVVAGSDDIANTYFIARVRQLQYDIPSYTELMVNGASDFLKQIHELGARRIAVLSAPPIGCVPSQRTLAGGIVRQCADKYNVAAKLFNSKLSNQIDSLSRTLPNSKLTFVNVYDSLLDIILNYQKYGFKVVDKGCCGTGNIEVAVLCNHLSPTCPDVTNYVFWDSYHPTEGVYKILIDQVLQTYLPRLLA
ncbi:hypothetical protein QN277_018223 [Acacia crassicarpa]|uniref:GDSL esterase/lipase EXL3 n=1 Tax=Acacia crassicarpa TaxID=499986 RepID=A0AAE1JVZ5_9FABA|nr:hypothetical protein QN277_018223 [Acacia crassicarpa]